MTNNTLLFERNFEEENCKEELIETLSKIITTNTVLCCIGTDKLIDDSLGPFVGSRLKENNIGLPVLGTIENPCHGKNLTYFHSIIETKYKDKKVLGIDACVTTGTQSPSIGTIKVNSKPIYPGRGVGKNLDTIGNYSLRGIISNNQHQLLFNIPNTRLYFVITFANFIADAITETYNKIIVNQKGRDE